MRIWIDVSNAPHAHFFKNILKKLEKNHEVVVTTRKFDSVSQILDFLKIKHHVIGEHGGETEKGKLIASAKRTLELAEFISDLEIDLALYKHSVEAARVSYGLKIPSICVFDNEKAVAQNKLMLPLSTKVIAPSSIKIHEITRFGVSRDRIVQFNGICELAHVKDFVPNHKVLRDLGLDKDIVVLRPEPAKANYFNGKKNKTIVKKILEEMNGEYQFVIFPRFAFQKEIFDFPNVVIPEKTVDTLSLIHYSSLVVSAGGTMNREAISLKTPAISTYPEKLLSVTKYLINLGLKKHSLDAKVVKKYGKEFLKDNSYKERAKRILKKMENPIDVVLREVEKFNIH